MKKRVKYSNLSSYFNQTWFLRFTTLFFYCNIYWTSKLNLYVHIYGKLNYVKFKFSWFQTTINTRKSAITNQLKLGDRFTSKSHGLRSVSISMSKPNNSKQHLECTTTFLLAAAICPCTENKAFITTSSTRTISTAIPNSITSFCLPKLYLNQWKYVLQFL